MTTDRATTRPAAALLVAAAFLLAASASAQSLSVTTLAGSTTGGGYVDDSGTAARFSAPGSVAVDSTGAVFIADTANHVIRRMTPDGEVTTWAGKAGEPGSADGVGAAARFFSPSGLAIDSANTLFVADAENHTIRRISASGVVTTVAGLARTPGTADGAVSVARFTFPYGVAVDSAGTIYVADTSNHVIRMIRSGAVSTLAGAARSSGSSDGFGAQARFKFPFDVAVDLNGNVLVADTENHTIRKVTPEGRVTTVAGAPYDSSNPDSTGGGDGTGVAARFRHPWSIDVGSTGDAFVADTWNHTIRKVTPAAIVTTVAGTARSLGNLNGIATAARFHAPSGIAVDRAGNILISDRYNHAIRRVAATSLNVTTVAGSVPVGGTSNGHGAAARFFFPESAAVDSLGNVFVADSSHTIRRIAPDGTVSTFAGAAGVSGSTDGSGSVARFRSPYGVAIDSSDHVYVADTGNHTIRKITPSGQVSTLAGFAGMSGSADGSGSQARFNTPFAVATDSRGNVYVADAYNHAIRMVEPAGIVTTFAGMGPSYPGSRDAVGTSAQFRYPVGIAVDASRNIYVADWGNHTIRKITQAGAVSTVAGRAGEYGGLDGIGGAARFDHPSGIAADSAGNVYVADTDNHLIRRISSAGVVTTLAGLTDAPGNINGNGRQARFFFPEGICVDSAGRVVIVDTYNHAIRVATFAAPTVTIFTATPQTIRKGESATLRWAASDASSVTIDNGIGTVLSSGSRVVAPNVTTTYRLTATGEGGSTAATVTVYVGGGRQRAVRH